MKITLIFVSKDKIENLGGEMDYIEMKPLKKQESWTLLQCLDIQDRGFTFGDWL